ncbi:MAG: EFR1 family ferrodoxin [Candidatus Ranarchaeia archaeon]
MKLIYYSPTETSKQVVKSIAEGVHSKSATQLDLTPPGARTVKIEEFGAELAIIGVPVYSGRIPVEATNRLRRIKTKDTPAVLVVVYGNRAFEDALLELKNITTDAGFIPLAGAAFIGEHSYSVSEKPIAQGRPDDRDKEKLHEFGLAIREKLNAIASVDKFQPLEVPGNYPYKALSKRSNDTAPVTKEDICIKCGTCAKVCPVAAITIGNTVETDPASCTFCTACVKNCPTNARLWEHPRILKGTEWLHTNFHKRKEPETYL